MDVPNGYGSGFGGRSHQAFGGGSNGFGGGSNAFGGGSNGFGGGSNGHYPNQGSSQNYHPQASTQTVNHGTNVFNFYFVNSGQYDLSFNGIGLPGVPPTASTTSTSQAQSQQPFTAASNPNSTGMFALRNPFPSTSVTHATAGNPNLFANYNTGGTSVATLPHFNGASSMSTVPLTTCSAFRPTQPCTGGHQPFANSASTCNMNVPNTYRGAHYSYYREGEPSSSQGSLEDEFIDEEDNRERHYGYLKPAPYGGHCHYNRYQ